VLHRRSAHSRNFTYLVVFIERGQRKILVNYARRQVGNKVYGGQSSHLPLKLNMAGRDPADLCLIDHPAAGHGGRLVQRRVSAMRWLKDIAGIR
jgi:preprotein translocase subunit SecY